MARRANTTLLSYFFKTCYIIKEIWYFMGRIWYRDREYHLLECIIRLDVSFAWMYHSLGCVIRLDVSFAWVYHSLCDVCYMRYMITFYGT
jgi:hypothetical protein